MDSTRGQFGCEVSSHSNLSTLIGVTILNRCGCEVMVEFRILFQDSDSRIFSNGAANSVDVAEGVHRDEL